MQYGGSRNETAICPAFQKLLEQYCADKKIALILELEYRTALVTAVIPDGTLKDAFRQDWGYWESKDQKDALDDEIQKKLAKGYPTTNILFEDGRTAVLIRNGRELQRASFDDHADPYPLKRIDKAPESGKPPLTAKAILKADKTNRTIQLDSITTLRDVPLEAWEYRLGNRSAIEWVLEYYKERKPKDPTIRTKFDAYRFADYKELVIELLQKICTVSVETTNIICEMMEKR